MRFLAFFITFFLLTAPVFSQTELNIKTFNMNTGSSETIGSIPKGKIWYEKNGQKLYWHNDNEIKSFDITKDKLKESTVYKIEDNNLLPVHDVVLQEKIKNESKKARPLKFSWNAKLFSEKITYITTDTGGEVMYACDDNGRIALYDIDDMSLIGVLHFKTRPIQYLTPLKNGSFLVFYDDGTARLISKIKTPFLWFLQTFKRSYVSAGEVSLPFSYFSRVSLNSKEDKALLIGDHKNLVALDMSTLKVLQVYKEKNYIRFADFIDGDNAIYLTMGVLPMGDDFLSVHKHLMVVMEYFDRRNSIITSDSGAAILMVNANNELAVYDVQTPRLLGILGVDMKNIGKISFSQNDAFLLVQSATEKNRLIVYKLQ